MAPQVTCPVFRFYAIVLVVLRLVCFACPLRSANAFARTFARGTQMAFAHGRGGTRLLSVFVDVREGNARPSGLSKQMWKRSAHCTHRMTPKPVDTSDSRALRLSSFSTVSGENCSCSSVGKCHPSNVCRREKIHSSIRRPHSTSPGR